MTKFAYAVAALATMTLASLATAAPADSGASILTAAPNDSVTAEQTPSLPPAPVADSSNSAPMTHSSVSTEVAAPIVVENAAPMKSAHVQHSHSSHRHRRPQKKQNVFEKLWEMEKKKNAWLKKTFLGI